eukprot:4669738-Prymnesium_polylepis.1
MAGGAACDADAPPLVVLAIVSEVLPSSHMFVRSAERYGYPLRFAYMNRSSTFVSSRMELQLDMLRAQCDDTVAMVLDAYDVFFHKPAPLALARFREANRSLIWSVERFYNCLLYTSPSPRDAHES